MSQTVYWQTDGTVKCLFVPPNDPQAIYIEEPSVIPFGWYLADFDDSSWQDAVQIGGQSQDSITPFVGLTSADPQLDLSVTPGLWWNFNNSAAYDTVLFRQQVFIPAGDADYSSLNLSYWTSPHTKHFMFPPDFPIDEGGHEIFQFFINGTFAGFSDSLNASLIVPNANNLFSFWILKPTSPGAPSIEMALYTPPPAWHAWRLITTTAAGGTASIDITPPVEGPAVVTPLIPPLSQDNYDPFLTGPMGFSGPVSIARGICWSGRRTELDQRDSGGLLAEPHTWAFNADNSLVPVTGGPVELEYRYGVTSIAPPLPAAETFAQGFVARWSTVEWVTITLFPTGLAPRVPWTATASIYNESSGAPFTALGSSQFSFAADTSVSGPSLVDYPSELQFQFTPPISVIPETTFFVVLTISGAPQGSVGLGSANAWSADAVPPLRDANLPIWGHLENTLQTLAKPFGTTTYSVATMTTVDATRFETHMGWPMAIYGEGLACLAQDSLWTSTPNGMGVGGRRDPNADNWPVSAIVSGWCHQPTLHWISDVDFGISGFPVTHQYQSGFSSGMGLFALNGDLWVIGLQTFTRPQFSAFIDARPGNWGPVKATPDSTTLALTGWPWGGSAIVYQSPDFEHSSRALARADGSIIALLQSQPETPVTTIRTRVGYQTLSGTDHSTALFGPLVEFNLGDDVDYKVAGMCQDANGNTHLFWYAYVNPGALFHCAVAPDGTQGLVTSFDSVNGLYKYPTGAACLIPSGGVMFPYVAANGQFRAAVWPNDITTLAPTIMQLPAFTPTLLDGRTVPYVYPRVITPGFTGGRYAPARPPPGVLVNGQNGFVYLFAMDSLGVSVARWDGITWTGLASWFQYAPLADGSNLFQWDLSGTFVTDRSQVGVLYTMGRNAVTDAEIIAGNATVTVPTTLFRWFTDDLVYPPFATTQKSRSYVQLIG